MPNIKIFMTEVNGEQRIISIATYKEIEHSNKTFSIIVKSKLARSCI